MQVAVVAILCAALAIPVALVGQSTDTPEAVIRKFVLAMYGRDAEAYSRVTTEHPLRARLIAGGTANTEAVRRLKDDPDGLQIREQRPKRASGKPVEGGAVPIGATALYIVAHGGGPMVVPMVKTSGGWKVDIRWHVAHQQMAMSSVPPAPEHLAIKELLIAMLALDRDRAAKYLTDPKAIGTLFTGAPRQREPSGVLEESVMEMPLVEIGAGDFAVLPSGRIVQGESTAASKVIVGLFGPIEMPFVLKRVGNAWKVEAEPYFLLINQ